MTTRLVNPVPYTPAQMRALHRLAAERGLSHEDLRAAAGVPSLTQLDRDGLARLIDRLSADKPARRVGRASRPPSAGRPTLGASKRQRRYIRTLADQLGWDAGVLAGWLAKRDIADLDGGVFTADEASHVIVQLQQALAKAAAAAGATFTRHADGTHTIDGGRP